MSGRAPEKRSWRPPELRSQALASPSALLACTPGLPFDCFKWDGIHYCVKNACGCINKPPHC